MRTIKLNFDIKALDCYLYGGNIYFIMQNGSIMYAPYPKIISRLARDYGEEDFSFLKLAFLRNEFYYSQQSRTFLNIPGMKEVLRWNWEKLSEKEFYLTYDDIDDILEPLCEWESIPLDMRIYGMRMYIGCRDGLYEIIVDGDKGRQKPQRCFDSKVTCVNAKYGELVVSADTEGLFATSIDLENGAKTRINEKKAIENRSLRTIWADTNLFNYYGKEEFSYLSNEYETVPAKKDRFWEHQETKRITRFAASKQPMESVMEKSGLKKEEIGYCFNSSNNAYVFLKNGKFKVFTLKDKKYNQIDGWGEIELPKYSRKGVKDDLIDYGRVISAFSIPKGSVMEFFDKVLLLKDGQSYIIEEEPTIRTRSFMSSIRYQDILSVTKEEKVTLHALDTLNVERKEIKGKKQSNAPLADIFNAIGLDFPVDNQDNDNDIPF